MNKQSMLTDEGRCLCGCDERCAVVAELRDQIQRLRQAIRVRDEEYALASSATPPAHGDGEVLAKLDAVILSMINTAGTYWSGSIRQWANELNTIRPLIATRPTPEAQEARDGAWLKGMLHEGVPLAVAKKVVLLVSEQAQD